MASFVAPRRWPATAAGRSEAINQEVARGSVAAARIVVAETAGDPSAARPGRPAALRRADAMVVVARDLPASQRAVELTVAAYLRGDLAAPHLAPGPGATEPAAAARRLAADLRIDGHPRPTVVATFPGFLANPYGSLMERAYRAHGLVALHVDNGAAVDAIVAGSEAGGYRSVVHLNASDRLVGSGSSDSEARGEADRALGQVDAWVAGGAVLVTSIHNGPRLVGARGIAERQVAQGVVDRARVVHVLTATTPEVLADWIRIDPAKVVHVPHPNFDASYPPLPDRNEARRRLELDPGAGPGFVVVGLLGSLADRKGGLLLLRTLARVPDPLPDGRSLRLVLAGALSGQSGEELIRMAMADRRVVPRFGFIADVEVPGLLAALDVAVVPYGHYLNSSWLHLALTAGIPVLAPQGGTATEVVHPDALRTFTANDEASLAAALMRAGELATPDARRAARASVADLDAGRLSEKFVLAVLAALDAASVEPTATP